jgi:hypothetical protein
MLLYNQRFFCSIAYDINSITEKYEKAQNMCMVKLVLGWQSTSIYGCIVVPLGRQKSYTVNLVML